MYGLHVAPQTHNKRTGLSIRNVKLHAGARVVAYGVSILMTGQLLLPCAALATEMPEPDVALPITCEEVNAEGSLTATTVVDHYYDLELPPAFELVQNEALVYDFPDKPEDFIYGLNDTVHLFKIDTDTESLIKTENPKEASVSIALTMIDNHVRATVVFTGITPTTKSLTGWTSTAQPTLAHTLTVTSTAGRGLGTKRGTITTSVTSSTVTCTCLQPIRAVPNPNRKPSPSPHRSPMQKSPRQIPFPPRQ